MTLQQFVKKWDGRTADWDGHYGGQCVDLYRFYCHEVLESPQSPSVRGAADVWTTYSSEVFNLVKNDPNNFPQPGGDKVHRFTSNGTFVVNGAAGGSSFFNFM